MKTTGFQLPGTALAGSAGGAASGPAGGDLGGSYPSPPVYGIGGYRLTTPGAAPAIGDTLVFNGTTWDYAPGGGGGGCGCAPLMTTDDGGAHWYVVVDGNGNAVMVEG